MNAERIVVSTHRLVTTPHSDQIVHAQAAQQRFERGPLEGVEAHLVHDQVSGPQPNVLPPRRPSAALQAVEAGQGAVPA